MGCFWGAERMFWETPGVVSSNVGYAGGHTPNPTYEEVCSGGTGHTEVVRVFYDPARVSYDDLLRVFWEGHDPTQGMRQHGDIGTQYRSAIYYFDDDQREAAEASRRDVSGTAPAAGYGEITTEIAPAPRVLLTRRRITSSTWRRTHTATAGTAARESAVRSASAALPPPDVDSPASRARRTPSLRSGAGPLGFASRHELGGFAPRHREKRRRTATLLQASASERCPASDRSEDVALGRAAAESFLIDASPSHVFGGGDLAAREAEAVDGVMLDVRHRFGDAVGHQKQIEVGHRDRSVRHHLLQQIGKRLPVCGAHEHDRELSNLAGLNQRQRFGQLVERAEAAGQTDEGVRST